MSWSSHGMGVLPFMAPFDAKSQKPSNPDRPSGCHQIATASSRKNSTSAMTDSGNLSVSQNLTWAETDKSNFLDAVYGDMEMLQADGTESSNTSNHYKVGVTYQSGSADYAEWLPRREAAQDFEPGQVVGVHEGYISLETAGAEKVLVVSTQPIILGNAPQGSAHLYEKTAFMGQVPVRVLGPVHSGDYILASGLNDGNAIAVSSTKMSAKDLDRLVGVAWENGRNAFKNVVNCAVGMPNTGGDLPHWGPYCKLQTVYCN